MKNIDVTHEITAQLRAEKKEPKKIKISQQTAEEKKMLLTQNLI